jgi:DNA adenine methylase
MYGDLNKKSQPFIKWAGGKRSLLSEIIPRVPQTFNQYHEPFIGGGAVFFALSGRLKETTISDNNIELTITYRVIQKEPESLIKLLEKHQENHSKEYYYVIRDEYEPQTGIETAARLIYLNKTCYNGLYRVNKKGNFNVPIGDYKEPNIVDEHTIHACHKALLNTKIRYLDFEDIKPEPGDFVYCDPPYHPTNLEFTGYTKQDFSEKDQKRLQEFIKRLTKQKVMVMLSNSNTEFIRGLYPEKKFYRRIVHAPRNVNCKPEGRKDVEELLITNYSITDSCNQAPVQTSLESVLKK